MFQITPNRIRITAPNGATVLDSDDNFPHIVGKISTSFFMTCDSYSSSVTKELANFGQAAIDFLICSASFGSATGGTRIIEEVEIHPARFVPIGPEAPRIYFQGSQLLSASGGRNGIIERKVLSVEISSGGRLNCVIKNHFSYEMNEGPSTPETWDIHFTIWYGCFKGKL